ncbi:hypothetical protein EBQ90_00090, partial [bacterium]|nr:hypothetical protein [bacterium]
TAQSGGSQLAANAQTGVTNDTYSVTLVSGVFSQTINLSAADFHTVFPDSTTGTWVQVQDMTAGTTYPRQQFTTVPYALKVPVDGSTITYNSSGQLQVSSFASGSSIGIGTASPHASAMLEVSSTTKGLLPPRMTTAQRNAITSPATGLIIYNSTTSQIEMYNGSGWMGVGSTIPTGVIAAFASSTCPSGWTEYTAARGRFLRGIDNGAGLDPDGTRAAGGAQNDAMQGHWHQSPTGILVGWQTSSSFNWGLNSGGEGMEKWELLVKLVLARLTTTISFEMRSRIAPMEHPAQPLKHDQRMSL